MKEDYQKYLKKANFVFLPNPVPFNVQSYQKQKRLLTSDQSLFKLRTKFRKIALLVIYYLTKLDDVIESSCWCISKITSANLCKPIHDIINYFTYICPFVSGKCGKEGKNTKIWISRERNELFRWNKKHFSQFLKRYHLAKKIKIW